MSRRRSVRLAVERWPLKQRFVISRGEKSEAVVIVVVLEEDGHTGWGECVPYRRYGESVESVAEQMRSVIPALEAGIDRSALQNLLTAGAARNAVDCALWDLRAKQTGKSVAETLGITVPRRSETAFTLSLDTPERMADEAARVPGCRLFKLKVGQGCSDLERVQAVHRVSPDAQLILDANEGWQPEQYRAIAPLLESYPVVALEQPVAVRNQDCLREIKTPIPVYADESCHDGQSLAGLRGLYQGVNVKLDKTGGLTEALDVMRRSKDLGFRIMLGCMVSTSLGLTPALHLAGYADILDLDGAITLVRDRDHPLQYHESTIDAGTAAVWGMPEKY